MSWIQPTAGFLLCTAVIIFSGTKLSKYGDRLAEVTGVGKAWIGLIVMSAVTSLPELISGLSAIVIVDVPDLAAGDVFGSCIFNLLILSVIDGLIRKPLTSLLRSSHIIAGACGIILISVASFGILVSDSLPVIGWISPITLLILCIYIASVWLIFRFEQKNPYPEISSEDLQIKSGETRKVIFLYGLHAVIVISAALFLPYFGNTMAEIMGISSTSFGTIFLALTTSMPELVVSIAAIRIGSLDMAVGNLFGSNIFNMMILGIDDVFYTKGSLYSNIDLQHLLSATVIIIMTAVATIGLLFKVERKRFRLSADTFIIFILYVGLMVTLLRN